MGPECVRRRLLQSGWLHARRGPPAGSGRSPAAPPEALGLIERLPDPDDDRAHLLALTADGRRRLGDARGSRRGRLRDHLATWADGDIRTLATLLAKFNAVPPAGAWSARA